MFKASMKINKINWQNISINLSTLRSANNLNLYNKAIAKFACKYLSPTKCEYSEKWCDGKKCDYCEYDKLNGYVSRNSLAKALTIYNKKNTWYDKIDIITTDMLRLWETGKVKPPLEYLFLIADICSLKIDDIVFTNII